LFRSGRYSLAEKEGLVLIRLKRKFVSLFEMKRSLAPVSKAEGKTRPSERRRLRGLLKEESKAVFRPRHREKLTAKLGRQSDASRIGGDGRTMPQPNAKEQKEVTTKGQSRKRHWIREFRPDLNGRHDPNPTS